MKKIGVIYKSIYGTTKRYAEWIAEDLGASLYEASNVKSIRLMDFDVVVYGGGLYAGSILGLKLVTKNPCNALVIFTVGLAAPEATDYSEVLSKNFTTKQLEKIKIFHLRGGMDYGKLSIVHKTMMAFKKKALEKKPMAERTSGNTQLLETYGGKVDFTDRNTIKPLIDYISPL
jgi:menaquinone-dependent protoporphyrinogen IX oxidase